MQASTERELGMIFAKLEALSEAIKEIEKRHIAQIEALERRHEAQMTEVNEKLDALTAKMGFAEGGWKVIGILGSVLIAAGALADRVFQWLWR